jgi:MoxR-like ATPase
MAVLLERDAELRLIEHAVARAADGHGGLVLLEGQAGVGKTALLRAAGSLAEAAGLRVLRGRGSELDRSFGFGVVRQLLELRQGDAAAAVRRRGARGDRLQRGAG